MLLLNIYRTLLFSLLAERSSSYYYNNTKDKFNYTIIEEDNLEIQKITKSNDIISTSPEDISFYLYPDSNNLTYHENLILGDAKFLKTSKYKTERSVTFYAHGFLTDYQYWTSQLLKDAYLKSKYPTNIILVDWGKLSTPKPVGPLIYYVAAVKNVPIVGRRIAEFIQFLYKNQFVADLKKVHIIGFSLGAHVAGIAGSSTKLLGLEPVGRITGLDPAGPLYQLTPDEEKIDPSDGSFVDIIHTNQGLKGYSGLLGMVDFFPNGGGPYQPDCINGTGGIEDIFTGTCSHARAPVYYSKSLAVNITACSCKKDLKGIIDSAKGHERNKPPNGMITPECKLNANANCLSPVIFGAYCPPTARGIYYLEISADK